MLVPPRMGRRRVARAWRIDAPHPASRAPRRLLGLLAAAPAREASARLARAWQAGRALGSGSTRTVVAPSPSGWCRAACHPSRRWSPFATSSAGSAAV
eukprot:7014806-Prymnesium_polylepis.1